MLTDLAGTVLGEITNATARQVVLPLNRVPTAAFQVNADHYLAPYLQDDTWDGLVKCYRDNTLRFIGPVVSSNEAFDGNSQTIQVAAASPLWRLTYRLLGTSTAGYHIGDASTTFDLGTIAQQMLTDANAAGYTGISSGTTVASTNGSVGTWFYKDMLSSLAEIATANGAFDWEVAPTEPTNVGQAWPRIGLLNCVPLLGTSKPNAIFEYGTDANPANVVAYSRQIDRSQMCNSGFIQQPARADYGGVLTSTDATSIATRGLFQAMIDDNGVQWDILRQALADLNVAIRKKARSVLAFTPATNANVQPFNDYIVGDQVRVRLINPHLGNTIIDGMLRVWGITFAIDDQENEDVQLELIKP